MKSKAQGRHFVFASPSITEGETIREALAHKSDIDRLEAAAGGLKYTPGIGVWKDGAEVSGVFPVHDNERGKLAHLAADLGHKMYQKQTVTFEERPEGKDRHHILSVPSRGLVGIHKKLLSHGIEFATLVPTGKQTVVHLLDSGGTLEPNIASFARETGSKRKTTPGTVTFLGGDTREEGRRAFEKILKLAVGSRGFRKGVDVRGQSQNERFRFARKQSEPLSDLAHSTAAVVDNPEDNTAYRILADHLMEQYPNDPAVPHFHAWVNGAAWIPSTNPLVRIFRTLKYRHYMPHPEIPAYDIREPTHGPATLPLGFRRETGAKDWTPTKQVVGRTHPERLPITKLKPWSTARVAQHLLNVDGPAGLIHFAIATRGARPGVNQRQNKYKFARKQAYRQDSPGAALATSYSANAQKRREIAEKIIKEAGLEPAAVRTVLTHEQGRGVRSGVLTAIQQRLDPKLATYVASWFGLLAREKRLLVFTPHDAGHDRLHIIASTLPVDEMGKYLTQAGIPKFSLEEHGSGTRAFIFSPQGSLDPNVSRVSGGTDARLTTYSGTGLKLGSRSGSDADARAKFRDAISKFEASSAPEQSTGPTS